MKVTATAYDAARGRIDSIERRLGDNYDLETFDRQAEMIRNAVNLTLYDTLAYLKTTSQPFWSIEIVVAQ